MSDVQAEPGLFQIIFRNDDETPVEFVVDLLHSVFKTSAADTSRFLEKIDKYGHLAQRLRHSPGAAIGKPGHQLVARLARLFIGFVRSGQSAGARPGKPGFPPRCSSSG